MFNFLNKITGNKVADVSFANLFWKKFALRLAILFLASLIVLSIAQPIVIDLCQNAIDQEIDNVSLKIMQADDFDLSENRLVAVQNKLLAKSQNTIANNKFVTNASMVLYNLSTRQTSANSLKMPVVYSDDFLNWWEDQSEIENGYPSIILSEEMEDLCKHYKDYDLHIAQAYCINTVVFVSKIVATDKNGKEIASCSSNAPSFDAHLYNKRAQFDMLGNDKDETIYKKIMDHKIIKQKPTLSNPNATTVIQYTDDLQEINIDVASESFKSNDTQYQLDCGYNISFWHGAWLWILIGEIVGILVCALAALLNTKETLYVRQ